MRDIYSKTERVIIWLGKGGPEDFEAFQLAKTLYQKCDENWCDVNRNTSFFKIFDFKSLGTPKPSSPALGCTLQYPKSYLVWSSVSLLGASSGPRLHHVEGSVGF
jgi:hypothetical protein